MTPSSLRSRHMASFLEAHWDDTAVQADVALVREQAAEDVAAGMPGATEIPTQDPRPRVRDADEPYRSDGRRPEDHWPQVPSRKDLAGRICPRQLLAHLFDDVQPALERWHAEARPCTSTHPGASPLRSCSLSTLSRATTPLLSGYFDTTTGPKKAADSYTSICEAVNLDPEQVCSLTDNLDEARAANAAGLTAILSVRPGNPSVPEHPFPTLTSFADLTERHEGSRHQFLQ